MRWNPLFNAAGAVAYISLVVSFIHYMESIRHDTPDTLLDGMAFLSLFVCSAAVMAFLFFYKPVSLLIENNKAGAISYFLKTLGIFALITISILTFSSLQ